MSARELHVSDACIGLICPSTPYTLRCHQRRLSWDDNLHKTQCFFIFVPDHGSQDPMRYPASIKVDLISAPAGLSLFYSSVPLIESDIKFSCASAIVSSSTSTLASVSPALSFVSLSLSDAFLGVRRERGEGRAFVGLVGELELVAGPVVHP